MQIKSPREASTTVPVLKTAAWRASMPFGAEERHCERRCKAAECDANMPYLADAALKTNQQHRASAETWPT